MMLERFFRRWADNYVESRLTEARLEIQRLEGVITIQQDQIKRLLDWQARETERLERDTAILTGQKVRALESVGQSRAIEEEWS